MTPRGRYELYMGIFAKIDRGVVTIRLDEDALEYFKSLAVEMEMLYQSLINSYLRECFRTHKRPSVKWVHG